MAVPMESSLSQACVAIRGFLQKNLETIGAERNPKVYFGAPKNSFENYKDDDDWVNLFFYRFEPFEFDADILSGETGWLRVHCLVTPVAKKIEDHGGTSGDPVSEGEQDLSGQKFHFQAVFESLTIESINQIWSTQGSEVAYRPSVGYEFTLAPVVPRVKAKEALLVGATGFTVDGNMDHAETVLAGEDYSAIVQTPVMAAISVNSGREGWVPAACFIYAGGCAQSLIFGIKDAEVFPKVIKNKDTGIIETTGDKVDALQIWIAGKIDQVVNLRWEVWDSVNGWQASVDASVSSFNIKSEMIDPNHIPVIPDVSVVSIDLPINTARQAVLYAEYSYERSSDKALLTVRSNPLMLTIYEVSS
ncbi:DUF4255 domain-containing protein [Mariprofundus ferrooxydans]|nr:DUF4255 domain-containing protein [Mariprofundus ferrooxydans]